MGVMWVRGSSSYGRGVLWSRGRSHAKNGMSVEWKGNYLLSVGGSSGAIRECIAWLAD
jgi:hypothetical protein